MFHLPSWGEAHSHIIPLLQVVVNVETHQMADIESVSGKGEVDWNDDHSYGKASSGSVM